jgi:DNA-binding response OmpR family regulator
MGAGPYERDAGDSRQRAHPLPTLCRPHAHGRSASGRSVDAVARLLLVEDDDDIAEPVVRALQRDGHEVERVDRGLGVLSKLGDDHVDLVILDLGLPDIDGVELCRRLRLQDERVPVIMVTARGDEMDLVVGLDAGADDYISKPFSMHELRARVRSRLRLARTDVVVVQDVRLDLSARRAWRADEELTLTNKEFDLLAILLSHAGRVVEREQIMAEVWDANWHGSTKTLDMHVSWLRRKLDDDPATPGYITTVRGVGLRFEEG